MIRAWRRRQRIMFLVAALQSPQGTFAPWKDVKAELQGLITEEFGEPPKVQALPKWPAGGGVK